MQSTICDHACHRAPSAPPHKSVSRCSLLFPSLKGYLRKEGGGASMLGRHSWKERFFVSQMGLLSYYETQAEFEIGHSPIKQRHVALRHYSVDM